jgi:signal transduction histidine kinase
LTELEEELRQLAFDRLKFLLFKLAIPINLFFVLSDFAQGSPFFEQFVYVRLALTLVVVTGFLLFRKIRATNYWLIVPYGISFAFSAGLGWIALKLGGEDSPYFSSGSSTVYLAATAFVVWPRAIHAVYVVAGSFLIFSAWLLTQEEPIIGKFMITHLGNMITFAAMGYFLNSLVIKLRVEEFSARKRLGVEIQNREKTIIEKVTALETARAEITTQQAQLETATRLADLASQVAHDIRSPLTALRMTLAEGAPKTDEALKISRTAMFRINDIANNLLNYRKRISPLTSSSINTDARSQMYLLAATIDQLLSEKRTVAGLSKKVEIDFEINATHLQMFTSIPSGDLTRVVSNIVGNAIDACTDAGLIKVTLHERDGFLLLKVKDNGKGIPKDVLPRLGEKGFTDGKLGGNGLGIYFAMEFLKSHGGRIDISSVEGKGTEVTLAVPASQPAPWSASAIALTPDTEIVVVDDDESIHQLWAQRLGALKLNLAVRYFFSPEEFEAWYANSKSGERVFVFDYEFTGQKTDGLDVIEKHALKNALLVTSRFEDVSVIQRVNRMSLKMIPKGMLQHVSMTLV